MLITVSRTAFRGEGEREVGFRSALRGSGRGIVEVTDSDGIDATNERLVLEALEANPAIEAVYSVGGGNTATVAASIGWAGRAGCSSPTTSTPTTGDCSGRGGSRSFCTTICGPTPAWRCG